MSAGEKIARLDRLVAIRQLREDLDRVTLQRATAALEEVDAAQRAAQTAVREARVAGRAALDAGERGDWIMADAQGEVAGWNRSRLEGLRAARAMAVPPAMERFLDSRRECEQVKLLMDAARLELRVDEDRRAQAAADDWFLARRARGMKRL